MRRFRPRRRGYVARIGETERTVFAAAAADVAQLLGAERFEDGGAGPAAEDAAAMRFRTSDIEPPDDPAVRRLLPDASRDDPTVAAEFRRLTEDDVRARKVAGLAAWWRSLAEVDERKPDRVVVRREDARAVAAAMSDVRLVLAERLGIRQDDDAERLLAELAAQPPDEPMVAARLYLLSAYDAMSWLQESLVQLMLEEAREATRRAARDGTDGGTVPGEAPPDEG